MNLTLRWFCIAVLLASGSIIASAATPAALQAADEKEKAAQRAVGRQRDEKAAALDKWYAEALEVIRKHGTEKGDLDLVVAAKGEIERHGAALSPQELEKLPPLVKGLRQQFEKASGSIAAWEQTNAQTATRAYLTELEALEKQYTRAAQIDEAVQVRTARAAAAARLAGRTLEVAATTSAPKPDEPPTVPAPEPKPAAEPATIPAPPLAEAPVPSKPKAVIPANSPDAYRLHDLRKGTRISLQYSSGAWKSWGRISSSNPEDVNTGGGDLCRVVISLPSEGGHAGKMLAMVPPATKGHPFVFEVPEDYPELVLRINDADDTYAGNPGKVEYEVDIIPPAQ
jgi:hypothetical protein